MQDRNLFEIVATTIEAAIVPDLWVKALDMIVDGYGARSGSLIILDPEHETRNLPLAMSRFMREDAFESYQRFMQGDDTDDSVAFQKVYELPENNIQDEYDLFGVKSYWEIPVSRFRDWMRDEFDIMRRYGTKLNRHGPWLDCLLLHTDSLKGAFTSGEKSEINNLSVVISSTLKTFRVMEQLKARFNAALNALNCLGIACFLTLEDTTVIHRNKAASEMLDQHDGIALDSKGRLKVTESESVTAKFSQACLAAFQTANAKSFCNEQVFSISRPSRKTDYLLTINPVIDAASELEPELKCVLIFLIDPQHHKSVSIEGLVHLGGLTRSESAVCQMLVDGLTTTEIMERRNVSENTVRQQIKTILNKLRCRNRVDLLRLAVDTELPVVRKSILTNSHSV